MSIEVQSKFSFASNGSRSVRHSLPVLADGLPSYKLHFSFIYKFIVTISQNFHSSCHLQVLVYKSRQIVHLGKLVIEGLRLARKISYRIPTTETNAVIEKAGAARLLPPTTDYHDGE